MSDKFIHKKAHLLMVLSPFILGMAGCDLEELQDEADIVEEVSHVKEVAAENEPEETEVSFETTDENAAVKGKGKEEPIEETVPETEEETEGSETFFILDDIVEPETIEEIRNGNTVDPRFIAELLQKDELGQTSDIHYNEQMVAIAVTPRDLAVGDAFVFSERPEVKEAFDFMVDNFVCLSEVVYEASNVGVILMNPLDADFILLWLEDGVVLYNAADDL